MLLAESSIVQRLDDPLVLLCILVMAGTGLKLGGFRSTLVGFGLLLSLDAALALAGWGGGMLVKVEVPQGYATLSAYAVVFVAGVAITVGSMQAALGDYAARLRPIPDGILGALAGVLSGVVLAATLHIGWSMATEVPAEYRFQPEEVEFKVGEAMLANVAGVSNSLADEMLERYRMGLWFGPLPVPEPEPEPEAEATGGSLEVVDGQGASTVEADDTVQPGGFLPTLPEGGLPAEAGDTPLAPLGSENGSGASPPPTYPSTAPSGGLSPEAPQP